ncbi:DNA polymerase [Chroococcidiopsis sp.]|uniref:DNA polymerase n=1 Tax=Chroococcidiopsis sp. TaxID=3088168 RepID=UPI003F2FA3AD
MQFNAHYLVTLSNVRKAIEYLVHDRPEYIGTDTETTGLDPHTSKIRLIQFAYERGTHIEVFVIDCFAVPEATQLIQNVLLPQTVQSTYVLHNAVFDIKMLWSHGVGLDRSRIFDTMLAYTVLEAGLDDLAGLEHIALVELGTVIDKSDQKSDWSAPVLSESQIAYSAKDAAILIELARRLNVRLNAEQLQSVFQLEMRTLFPTACMEWYGVRLDVEKLNSIRPIHEQKVKACEESFIESVPDRYERKNLFGEVLDSGFSMTSSDQVLKTLQSLEIPNPQYDPDSRDEKLRSQLIPSTGKDMITLLDWNDYPILETLSDHRKATKLLSSYFKTLPDKINAVTNRIHTHFRQCVSTGRFSSSGPNLQQMPRANSADDTSVRSCFIPEDGNVFVGADYSQIELRVIAEVANDPVMLEEFLSDQDPYANTAAYLSGMTYEEFCALDKLEYKSRRQKSKAVRLGYNYAMQAASFRLYAKQQYKVSMTLAEAKQNRAKYFELYKELSNYHARFEPRSTRETRTLEPYRRRRRWHTYPGIPALANAPIQGTSGDITKSAMSVLYQRLYDDGFSPLQSHDVRLLLTIHDELICECTAELADYTAALLERSMIEAGQEVLKICPVTCEAKIMNHLGEKD